MSSIQAELQGLRRLPGAKGVAVVTTDGLVAAADLDAAFRAEVVAGLASYLLMTTDRSLREGGLGPCQGFVLQATHGKAVFEALPQAYLVVLFDQFTDVAAPRVEVRAAAQRLRRTARLG